MVVGMAVGATEWASVAATGTAPATVLQDK